MHTSIKLPTYSSSNVTSRSNATSPPRGISRSCWCCVPNPKPKSPKKLKTQMSHNYVCKYACFLDCVRKHLFKKHCINHVLSTEWNCLQLFTFTNKTPTTDYSTVLKGSRHTHTEVSDKQPAQNKPRKWIKWIREATALLQTLFTTAVIYLSFFFVW